MRRNLYAEGKFRPRQTMIFWRRADMLAWAHAYEDSDSDVEGARTSGMVVPSQGGPLL